MSHKIENIKTATWHRIIEDLVGSGFAEVYRYGGADAGIDYGRYDLVSQSGDEVIIFEWDNWGEGEISATRPRLEALRQKYKLPEPVEVG